jgi:hypothetical protein
VSKKDVTDLRGTYALTGETFNNTVLKITGKPGSYEANIERSGADSIKTKGTIVRTGDLLNLYFDLKNKPSGTVRLNGYIASVSPLTLKGSGVLADGNSIGWTATLTAAAPADTKRDTTSKPKPTTGPVIYPFVAYGNAELPKK